MCLPIRFCLCLKEDKVDDEEKPKKGAKKGKKTAEVADKKAPPKKRAAAKKAAEKAADSEDAGEGDDESEGEDEPLTKKAKTPPTVSSLYMFQRLNLCMGLFQICSVRYRFHQNWFLVN